jgi:hypothetical protein
MTVKFLRETGEQISISQESITEWLDAYLDADVKLDPLLLEQAQ